IRKILICTAKMSMLITGEENEESCSCPTAVLYDEADRCPICLNCLLGQEVGFPENCRHFFCMTCILKWAEVSFRTKM
uniref:Zinc finger C3HC4 RING-type domain-containing protein n=1 Tax=Chelydra serpentina TaxID=8475 RepID=A0A8C3RY16_CHESE